MHDIPSKEGGKQEKPVVVPAQGTVSVLTPEEAMQLSNISLWIDDYNDIFSDFDPRPYSERALSVDFLDEANRATRDKPSGQIMLKLLVPESKRKTEDEVIIKKRLKEHFKKRHKIGQEDVKKVIKHGAIFAFIGLVLMMTAAYIIFKHAEVNLLTSFLIVFLEPAGWFFFWEGLAMIMFESKKVSPNIEFNEKMSKCEFVFFSY
ncbi:hypothetical protein HZA97_08265 [Candidatus Woesearchaeota archaeon]|nr:hypothetical protein [Candidatus Woesearchaeota archaeon]